MELRLVFVLLVAVMCADGCWWSFEEFMDVSATSATVVLGRTECPDASTLGDSDVYECTSDDDCSDVDGVTYICCDTNGGGFTCAEYTLDEGEREGSCPLIETAECVEDCTVDTDCPDDQKCCMNGCGNVCSDPDEGRPGECPPSSTLTNATSVDECSVDDDCSSANLCCENRYDYYECAAVSEPV